MIQINRYVRSSKQTHVVLARIIGICFIYGPIFQVKLKPKCLLVGNPRPIPGENHSRRLWVGIVCQEDTCPALAVQSDVIQIKHDIGEFFVEHPGLNLRGDLAQANVVLEGVKDIVR